MITRETLSELLDVLNVQASHVATATQCAYCDGLKNMLEMVMTDYYRKPGVVIALPINGVTKYVFIDEGGNTCS